MKHFTTGCLIGAVVLLTSADALAQRWGRAPVPSRGACFYEDINYGGQYFCYAVGAGIPAVPAGANDRISSIRVFGNIEVTVFNGRRFSGLSRRFTSNMNNLVRSGWNDRISSFQVDERSSRGALRGGGAYGGGNWGAGTGASGQGGGYGGGWGGAYGTGSNGGWGNADGGNRWTYQQASQIVRRAYQSTLGREPDPAASTWVNEVMKQNWSQAQLEAELRKSPEYRNRRF